MYGRKKILVFTATYNEKENIELLVDKIIKTSPNVDILIIDDNSPDNTAEKVIQLKKKYNNITLITRDSKKGLDTAHKKAYSYAVNNRYDYLITMDADLSHDPVEINNILLNLDKFPFVIGSRYVENGKCLMHGRRLFLSQYGNKLIKFLLNINCNDYTTGYRGFDIASLNGFNLSLVELLTFF